MGTRNLTCVVQDGKFKVAQYGQWDGYPEGAGAWIANFLKEDGNIDKLRTALNRVSFLQSGELKKRLYEANIGIMMLGSEQEQQYKRDFYWYDRDLGYKILEALVNSQDEKIELEDWSAFSTDSLFCEWAYVVDLDANTLVVYKGFNEDKSREAGHFENIEESGLNEYGTVYPVVVYSLDDLPDNQQLIDDCYDEE